MKVGLEWLSDWVAFNPDVAALAHQLTMAGFEVEGRSLAAPAFEGVVIGEILAAEKHPQADKLRVCSVAGPDGERLTIVCGAPNARAGLKAPLARIGAKLPGGIAIKRAKLRGVESEGMLCSSRELGLGEDHDGLMELLADAVVGTSAGDTTSTTASASRLS